MHPTLPADRPSRRFRRLAAVVATAVVTTLAGGVTAGSAEASSASTPNPVTPGDLTGYAFDQCTAPSQSAMDAWLTASPYWAVGIYISGASRGCTQQPNLTPTWVRTQLARGWRLLPVTLGPQAWCTTRERYLHQVRINPSPGTSYANARAQGRAEASKTVGVARQLGITTGSTLWYDIEAFDISRHDCRESALSFLSAWTRQLHYLHYVSGVYSSAASGIKMLDDARATRPGVYAIPNRIWIGDWNGRPDVYSSYIRPKGWLPHRRVHQYRGGHDETYGGVRINIDTSWVDLGRGSTLPPEPRHCGGAATYDFHHYADRVLGDKGVLVHTIQCLLRARHLYAGSVDGLYDAPVGAAVKAFRAGAGLPADTSMTRATWVALLSAGATPMVKVGSAGTAVRRLQRALNAAEGAGLKVTGVFATGTTDAVKAYQGSHGMVRTGVAGSGVWRRLQAGMH
jgi:hypothetical protein